MRSFSETEEDIWHRSTINHRRRAIVGTLVVGFVIFPLLLLLADEEYRNDELGFSFKYPTAWEAVPGQDDATLLDLYEPQRYIIGYVYHTALPSGVPIEEAVKGLNEDNLRSMTDVKKISNKTTRLAGDREARVSEYEGRGEYGATYRVIIASVVGWGKVFEFVAWGYPNEVKGRMGVINGMISSMTLEMPRVHGISRDEALVWLGEESNNPREYDPATGSFEELVFSGLVSFSPQLAVMPDLAESWDISTDGTVYVFHLRKNARFHDGRPFTAKDVIYSWERAADPKTDSDTVLTYLGDIIGVREKREGEAREIRGLKAIDDYTLQVTIDAPKPYFLMKLTYNVAMVVDRANVESGPEWYRTPNGTGPYKLVRWDQNKVQIYERNDDFYLGPVPARYQIVQLYAGTEMQMYETGQVDLAGVSLYDVERVRDPQEPLHRDLREGVSTCTSYVLFDADRPPFDDPKVRQAFALAVDKVQYNEVVQRGVGIPARGLFPPSLPGYNSRLKGLSFNPQMARQRLGESRYGGADKLPEIVFTSTGFGSEVSPMVEVLAQMWQTNLGVTIQIENLEPDKVHDELYAGRHGQLVASGWCADYPDPENFADALFHTGAEQNIGNYSNPALDEILEKARVERDVARRMEMYQQAETIIVEDAAAIFMNHSLSYSLVKPYVKGYEWTPIRVPLERYIWIEPSEMGE